MLFTETLVKEHFILYKEEISTKVQKKEKKAEWNFFSVGEIKGMLMCIRDDGMQII